MSLLLRSSIVAAAMVAMGGAQGQAVRGPVAQAGVAQAAPQGLNAGQLSAIRLVGRQVLAAKHSGSQDDGGDTAQLARLRAALDKLIAADLDPANRTPITVQGQESTEQRSRRERTLGLRDAARADARAVTAQLRSRGELVRSRARGGDREDVRSAGMPVGEQRADLFERWSRKLDAALEGNPSERAGRLRELRQELQATKGLKGPKGGLSEAPLSHGTPTLQAMPAGYKPAATTREGGEQ